MRLGGPVFEPCESPQAWVATVAARGYRAAFCPLAPDAPETSVRAYRQAAADADIVIAEVGAWSNPISPDPDERALAMDKCKRSLELAERIGARCCVNIAGSRGARWDGPHPDNLTHETFDLIVAAVQEIVDAVGPEHTRYALETMPWVFPDSAESYVDLLRAVDRRGFAVHLDPVNLVNCPSRLYDTDELLRECFRRLGPHIRSCHAKDISLADNLTVHLSEVRPGLGSLDYATYLRELDALPEDVPLMLEHLPDAGEYDLAAAHVRSVASQVGCSL